MMSTVLMYLTIYFNEGLVEETGFEKLVICGCNFRSINELPKMAEVHCACSISHFDILQRSYYPSHLRREIVFLLNIRSRYALKHSTCYWYVIVFSQSRENEILRISPKRMTFDNLRDVLKDDRRVN